MSSALYAMRLMWLGGRGDIGFDGIHIVLREMPSVLRALGVVEIQFTPEVRVAIVRELADRWRDMTAPEREAVRAWIEKRSAAVWAAFESETQNEQH